MVTLFLCSFQATVTRWWFIRGSNAPSATSWPSRSTCCGNTRLRNTLPSTSCQTSTCTTWPTTPWSVKSAPRTSKLRNCCTDIKLVTIQRLRRFPMRGNVSSVERNFATSGCWSATRTPCTHPPSPNPSVKSATRNTRAGKSLSGIKIVFTSTQKRHFRSRATFVTSNLSRGKFCNVTSRRNIRRPYPQLRPRVIFATRSTKIRKCFHATNLIHTRHRGKFFAQCATIHSRASGACTCTKRLFTRAKSGSVTNAERFLVWKYVWTATLRVVTAPTTKWRAEFAKNISPGKISQKRILKLLMARKSLNA